MRARMSLIDSGPNAWSNSAEPHQWSRWSGWSRRSTNRPSTPWRSKDSSAIHPVEPGDALGQGGLRGRAGDEPGLVVPTSGRRR